MKKHEKPFKMDKRLGNAVAYNNLCVRAYLSIQQHALNFCDYVKTGIMGAALLLIIIHPMILFTFLMSFNVIGDVPRNIVYLSVFLVDCALSFIGGVIVEYVRTQ